MSNQAVPVQRDTINMMGGIIGIILSMILSFMVWALIFHEIPDKNAQALLILIGCVTTNITSIVGFYYGSSYLAKKSSEAAVTGAQTNATLAQAVTSALESTPPQDGKGEVVASATVTIPRPTTVTKPNDVTQEAWGRMTAAEQSAEVMRRATVTTAKGP